MRLRTILASACLAGLAFAAPAHAKPPMEAFGDMPQVRAMQLSPDGKKVAFLQRQNGDDVLVIHDLTTSKSQGITRVSEIKARYIHFVGNDYVVLIATKEARAAGFAGRWEASSAHAFNLQTGKSVLLLRETKDIFPAQSGLGRILGVEPDGKHILMPAYMGMNDSNPDYDLLRVAIDTGRGTLLEGGRASDETVDWLVDSKGRAAVREDFSETFKQHEVKARQPDGSWKAIYEKDTDLPVINVVGLSSDSKSLFTVDAGESDFLSLRTLSMADGTFSDPIMQRDDADVAATVSDLNRVVYGVRYSGMFPSYEMFDEKVEADLNQLMGSFDGSAVYLDSWSDDWSRLLLLVEGGKQAERYYLYDRTTKQLRVIASARPEIKAEDVGEVVTVAYKARDGLPIPSLITWPVGVAPENRKNLPLIVMPHGGPQAYDSVGFDWLAQFIANEGYAVLQPNFRGSGGFGSSFAVAGHGEWGRKMQDDITDGVNALIKMGWADPSRVCIVGWSYGGYAALAGGTSTPDLYKCVVSIAGVSHLREMLKTEKQEHGALSRTLTYWEELIGDSDKDGAAIDAVSPALHADKFKAPVLLIHGASDNVVPIRQSIMMNDALKGARKDVQFIRIAGDDHSLVDNESRRQVLIALTEFLNTHIGKKPN